MTDSEIREIVTQGETSNVEFKTRIVQPQILSRNISAFANANGGTILVGIDERHGIVGCNAQQLRQELEAAQCSTKGTIDTSLEFVHVDGKDVEVISVTEAHGLVSSMGGVFIRRGSAVLAMTPQEIEKRISPEESPIGRLTEMVTEQTKRIEELQDEIRKGNSWQSKAMEYIIGGQVGASIGFI